MKTINVTPLIYCISKTYYLLSQIYRKYPKNHVTSKQQYINQPKRKTKPMCSRKKVKTNAKNEALMEAIKSISTKIN